MAGHLLEVRLRHARVVTPLLHWHVFKRLDCSRQEASALHW